MTILNIGIKNCSRKTKGTFYKRQNMTDCY